MHPTTQSAHGGKAVPEARRVHPPDDLVLSIALAAIVRMGHRVEKGSPARGALARCSRILYEALHV